MVTLLRVESRFKLKHSLDSDEEDEKDEVQDSRLGDEDLAAQEDTTIVSMRGAAIGAPKVAEYISTPSSYRGLMMAFK